MKQILSEIIELEIEKLLASTHLTDQEKQAVLEETLEALASHESLNKKSK